MSVTDLAAVRRSDVMGTRAVVLLLVSVAAAYVVEYLCIRIRFYDELHIADSGTRCFPVSGTQWNQRPRGVCTVGR